MMRKLSFTCLIALSLLMTAGPAAAQDEKPEPQALELADVLAWNRVGNATVSDDGTWFAYALFPAEGDGEIIIRQTRGDRELKFPIGESPRHSVAFADDSNWVAFRIYPTEKEAERAQNQRPRQRLNNKAGLVNLATGDKVEFEKIRSFAFSGEQSKWLALHKAADRGNGPERGAAQTGPRNGPPNGEDEEEAPTESDLILYELETGSMLNIGNVSEFAFNKSGDWLTWVISAEDQIGNGIQVRNMNSGIVLPLDNDKANYRSLSWTEKGDAFAALKGKKNKKYEDDLYSLLGFSNLSSSGADKVFYDPLEDSEFPSGMTISESRRPQWMDDLDGILFGIGEAEQQDANEGEEESADAEDEESDSEQDESDTTGRGNRRADEEPEKADLVVWHYMDERLQSQQQVQEQRDKNFSFLSIYRIAEDRFIRLADDEVRQVTAGPNDRFAIGTDIRRYELPGNLDGRRYRDIYAVDLRTGSRTLAAERLRWFNGTNPQSDHFLYYKAGDYHTYDMVSGEHRNITENVGTSFINAEDDHNIVDPPIRPLGWSEDGQSVLLYDNWDIWKVAAHGEGGENLTVNGRTDGIRYNRVLRLDREDEGIDLSEPVYFNAYGEWTKKSGLARMEPGGARTELLTWDDRTLANLLKAKDSDTYLYTRQTNEDYPDYYVADGTLKDATPVTDANPQQKDLLWSDGAMLIDYESDKGDRLQAALYLPSNYQEGKSYPTIVFIYEKRSQGLNRYVQPVAYGFNKSVYTSNGYAVLEPDITYKLNDPGMSAVWSVLPALDAAIATGVVDETRVGLHGHCWGGYQTSFLITQTDRFKAAAAGAPLTNLVSMYSSIYWNTGGANQAIFESSQGRFQGGYWDNIDAYTRNSPVYYATRVTTPLLLLHNDQDGAVDWNQGIEFFNTLRRLNKSVVMLQYVGENHGLREDANRKDYFVRMQEFFDHHLLDKEAPMWLKEGVDHLDLDNHLEERAKEIKSSSGGF